MKMLLVGILAGIVLSLLFLVHPAVRATEGEEHYRISQSGAGAFVVLDTRTGAWEHLSTRPNAQGKLTVMRGRVGEERARQIEIQLDR